MLLPSKRIMMDLVFYAQSIWMNKVMCAKENKYTGYPGRQDGSLLMDVEAITAEIEDLLIRENTRRREAH